MAIVAALPAMFAVSIRRRVFDAAEYVAEDAAAKMVAFQSAAASSTRRNFRHHLAALYDLVVSIRRRVFDAAE